MITPWELLADPVYRAPILGASLMSVSTSLLGVVLFVRRRAMFGEALSHAAYPGVIFALVASALLGLESSFITNLMSMGGAFICALLANGISVWMERHLRYNSDTILTFLLAAFLGAGVFLAALLQQIAPQFFRQAEAFLYGQIATMRSVHIFFYGGLALITVIVAFRALPLLKILLFDRSYAESRGIKAKKALMILDIWLIISIVIGMKSVGIILLIGMLIAPAAAARLWISGVKMMCIASVAIGLCSAFFGGYLSILLAEGMWGAPLFLPPGPLIVIVATLIALISLCIAPQKGYLARSFSHLSFGWRCHLENILKDMWKKGNKTPISRFELKGELGMSPLRARVSLTILKLLGYVRCEGSGLKLTPKGERQGAHIVRKHRLWELYLVSCLDQKGGLVHRSAEEMEHIMTPELERQLVLLLDDPEFDPHQQPIPKVEDV